jgi:hypothetical protein
MTWHITFSPIRMDGVLTLSCAGDVLTINGAALDLSAMDDGDTLPIGSVDHPMIAGDITKSGGQIAVTLLLPHGLPAPPALSWRACS